VVEAVSVIEVGVPALTVTVVVGVLTVPEAALIVVVQMPVMVFTGVTRPVELIVAQAVVLELQLTFPVKFCVEPSLNVPVAAICNVWEVVMVWSCGPIAIEESVGFTKKPVHPVAMAKSKKAQPAAISEYLRSKFRIKKTPRQRAFQTRFTQQLTKIVAERLGRKSDTVPTCATPCLSVERHLGLLLRKEFPAIFGRFSPFWQSPVGGSDRIECS